MGLLTLIAATAKVYMYFIGAAQAAPVPVALSGAAAPAGGNYGALVFPVLNDAGQVAFRADLTGGSSTQGIFVGMPGSIQAAALAGSAAPTGGDYGPGFGFPLLNSAGQVAFKATVASSPEGSSGAIMAGAPGSIQTAALQGTASPAGGNYQIFGDPVLNESGQVAIVASLTSGSSGVALFAGAPGMLQAIVLGGTAAPAGGNYSSIGSPFLNNAGHVAFFATLSGGSSIQGLFAGEPGSLQAAALSGAAAPAGGNYAHFENNLALNDAGQVAFRADLTGGSSTQGIFTGVPGSLQAAVLVGAAAPAGGNYADLDTPVLNGAGQVAFRADLTGGSSIQGIFTGVPGSLQAAALRGRAAPVSGGLTGNYGSFGPPVLNGAGQVAFISALTGAGITTANDTVLFAGFPGSLMQIVREGDVIDVDPGQGIDNRTVAANGISFLTGSGGQDGRKVSFNDNGLLVYQLTFVGGTSGIFTSQIPGPVLLGDFDEDGDVDGQDFLVWQRGDLPNPLSATDLADWQTHFGASSSTVTAAVPEPSCIAILIGLLFLRRLPTA